MLDEIMKIRKTAQTRKIEQIRKTRAGGFVGVSWEVYVDDTGILLAAYDELKAEVGRLLEERNEVREEVKVDEALLRERDRVMSAIPECPIHGHQCVPHAIEWVEEIQAEVDRLRSEKCIKCGGELDTSHLCLECQEKEFAKMFVKPRRVRRYVGRLVEEDEEVS